MNKRLTAGIGIIAAAAFAFSGCAATGTPTTTITITTSQISPAEALTAALGKLKGQSYDVNLTNRGGTISAHASVHGAENSASFSEQGSVEGQHVSISATEVGTRLWVKADFGPLNAQLSIDPSKWMLVDKSRITKVSGVPFDLAGPDAFGVTGLLTSVSGVTRTDATHLAGTVDLTAATGINKPAAEDLTKAGAVAKTLPIAVTLDDQGRLVELKITASGTAADLAGQLVISNHGSPGPITTPPAADVIPAPPALYEILNS